MLNKKEKIEFFCEHNEFDAELTPTYIKFIKEEFNNFKEFSDVAYEMKRTSHAFKTLNKYHSEAMKDKEYQKMYLTAVDAAHEELSKKEK
jgi:hypothetical protein